MSLLLICGHMEEREEMERECGGEGTSRYVVVQTQINYLISVYTVVSRYDRQGHAWLRKIAPYNASF